MSLLCRDDCEKLAAAINACLCEGHLEARDWSVAYYHAGLGQSDRARVQRQWHEGTIVAVVATIAFGMGIDKADIRWVAHYMVASGLEAFAQVRRRLCAGASSAAPLPPLLLSPCSSLYDSFRWRETRRPTRQACQCHVFVGPVR